MKYSEKSLILNLFFYKVGYNKYSALNTPVSIEEFFNILVKSVKYNPIGFNEILKSQYDEYLEKFDVLKNKNRLSLLSPCRIFDKWETSLRKIDFYLCRGYSVEESTELLRLAQSRKLSKESLLKIQETLRNNPNIESINKSKGNSSRAEFYLGKINPLTNELFTIEEAKQKIKLKQSIGGRIMWEKVKSGELEYFSSASLQYYLNKGHNDETAIKLRSERQKTFSLEKCIKKLGEEEGLIRFNQRQDKWLKTLDDKPQEEKDRIRIAKTAHLPRYSKVSFNLFSKLVTLLKDNNFDIFFGKNELILFDRVKHRPFFYDFGIPAIKLIIEYNGIAFHPKEDCSEEVKLNWRCPLTKLNYADKLELDNYKINFAKNIGYDVLIIWEDEDEDEAIKKCTEFINLKITEYDKTRKD